MCCGLLRLHLLRLHLHLLRLHLHLLRLHLHLLRLHLHLLRLRRDGFYGRFVCRTLNFLCIKYKTIVGFILVLDFARVFRRRVHVNDSGRRGRQIDKEQADG